MNFIDNCQKYEYKHAEGTICKIYRCHFHASLFRILGQRQIRSAVSCHYDVNWVLLYNVQSTLTKIGLVRSALTHTQILQLDDDNESNHLICFLLFCFFNRSEY